LLLVIILMLPAWSHAQSSRLDSLERAQKRLQQDLAITKRAREETRNKKESTLAELRLVNQQVKLREELLSSMRQQLSELDQKIFSVQLTIESLESDITKVQENYGRLMVVVYKALAHKSPTFYLISSQNVSQAYQRAQYFKSITAMQESQMRLLRRTKAFLAIKRLELEQSKVEKQRVAEEEKLEKERLVVVKQEQKKLYDNLKGDEIRLNKMIQDTENTLAALKKAIRSEMDRIVSNKKKKPVTREEEDIVLSLTRDFDQNKGKFPWPMPMPNATITRHFGVQSISGTNAVVDLQGIDINTLPGQAVRTVFGGNVESVMPVPGQGKMVILSHGNYYTVYANLENVSVKAGDKLDGMKTIGTARTDAGTGETKVHFQVYKERTPMDPESWLVRKN
jgi:murein hydrolase activator